jgi:hypothetical protein
MAKNAMSFWMKTAAVVGALFGVRWLLRRRKVNRLTRLLANGTLAQHVRIHIPVTAGMGTPEERERISTLEDRLENAVQPFGMHDGNEYGEGACELYFYGPDADRLYQAIAPILEDVPDGSFVLKRSGGPDVEPTRIALPDR